MSKKRPSVPPSPLDEEGIMFPNGYEPPEKRLKKKRLQTENPDNSIFLSQHADIPTSNHANMERRQVADMPSSQHSGVEAGLHDSKELSQHPNITPSLQDSTESSQHGGKALSLHNSMELSQHGSIEPFLHDSKELSQQGNMEPSLQDSKEASHNNKELSPGGKELLQQDSGASNSTPAKPNFFAPPEKTQQDMPPEQKSSSQYDDIKEQHRPEIPTHTNTLSIYQDRNEEPVLHGYKSTTQGDIDTATNLPKATFYLRPGLKEYLNTMALYFNTPVYKLVIEAIDKFIEQLPPEDRKTIDLIHSATQKKRKPHS